MYDIVREGVRSNPLIRVNFGQHIPQSRAAGVVSGLAAFGNVTPWSDDQCFAVEVFRHTKLPRLKAQLLAWERYGFLSYTEEGDG